MHNATEQRHAFRPGHQQTITEGPLFFQHGDGPSGGVGVVRVFWGRSDDDSSVRTLIDEESVAVLMFEMAGTRRSRARSCNSTAISGWNACHTPTKSTAVNSQTCCPPKTSDNIRTALLYHCYGDIGPETRGTSFLE